MRNGPLSLSHTRTRTHAHRTQSPTLVFYWGLFGLQGEKVLDARIDRLTAEYSIFEFSGTVEGVSTDAQPHPAATNCKVVPGSHPSLLCRLFSQRPPVAHVCMGECGCLYVCAVRLCVCVCVCDVSHGTRLTQHPLASHNYPFERSCARPRPAQLQVRRIGFLGKAGGEGVRGQDPSIDPSWFEKRGPILDPNSMKSHPPCSWPVQCYSYQE